MVGSASSDSALAEIGKQRIAARESMSARAFLSLFMRVFLLFLFIRFCVMCDCEHVEHSAEDAEHDGDVREAAAACVRQTVQRAVDCCISRGAAA